jgi:hypothetical protein
LVHALTLFLQASVPSPFSQLVVAVAVRLTSVVVAAADKLFNQRLHFLVRSPLWWVQVAQLATTASATQRAAAVPEELHRSPTARKP